VRPRPLRRQKTLLSGNFTCADKPNLRVWTRWIDREQSATPSLRVEPSSPARMATEQIRKAEAERLAALRDFDDDDDPNQNRSALDIGKDDVWEQQEAVKNADGTIAETAFDGFMRLGTNREILSWPGDSGEYYLVKTEGDEAKAQARLRQERKELRDAHQAELAFKKKLEQEDKKKRESDFERRQREYRELQARTQAEDKSARKKAFNDNLHVWARVGDPGYGPDRWLWPKAYHEPRTYVTPGGDVAIMKDSRNGTIASGPGAALGIPIGSRSQLSSSGVWSSASGGGSPSRGSP
jgi:hypothetical protein